MAHVCFLPDDVKLTEHDLSECMDAYKRLQADEGTDEAILMLSFGYAEVWPDGSVNAFGNQIVVDLDASRVL